MYILEDLITPNYKKLKAIRKLLKINQEQLANGVIHRTLISYIECGKTKITIQTAKLLAHNIKSIIEERNLPYEVDHNYILACENEQVAYKLKSKIEKLRTLLVNRQWDDFKKELKDAEDIIQKWDVYDKKAEIYDLVGDFYYNIQSYDLSKIYYMKSLENYVRICDTKNIALENFKLSKCAYEKENYEEALNLNNYALSILRLNNIKSDSLIEKILYNNAVFSVKLKRYTEGLELTNTLLDKIKDKDCLSVLDVYILRAFVLSSQNDKEGALEEYLKVIDIAKDTNQINALCKAYEGLSELYKKDGDIDESINHLNKALEIHEGTMAEVSIHPLRVLAQRYVELQRYDIAIESLYKALEIAKFHEKINTQIEIYSSMIDIYLKLGHDRRISTDGIIKFIKEGEDKTNLKEIIIKLSNYYLDIDILKVKEILNLYD